MLDIPYPLLDECGTLMCYTDMKMSCRVELELDSQNKTGEEAGSGSLRGVTGASGEALSVPPGQDRRAPQSRLEEENLGWVTVCTWEQMTSEWWGGGRSDEGGGGRTGVRTEGGWCLSLKELLCHHWATGQGSWTLSVGGRRQSEC